MHVLNILSVLVNCITTFWERARITVCCSLSISTFLLSRLFHILVLGRTLTPIVRISGFSLCFNFDYHRSAFPRVVMMLLRHTCITKVVAPECTEVQKGSNYDSPNKE